MVAIHIDANYNFCKPMKNITEGKMIAAYQQIIKRMRMANLGLKYHRLDNKASTAFKECIKDNGMTHKLVPPSNYRHNLAERAIQTFKHHFISILSKVDKNSHYPSGVTYTAQQNSLSTYYASQMLPQRYRSMPMSTANTIT
jgi:hypothetical protein